MKRHELEKLASTIGDLYGRELSMTEIAKRPDVNASSRQRVHEILTKHPDIYDAAKRKRRESRESEKIRREQELDAKLLARMQRALDEDLRCAVCNSWILRKTKRRYIARTCSIGCAEDYRRAPWAFSEEARMRLRRTVAERVLRYQEKHKPSKIKWAKKVLFGDDPGPNKRYTIPGSFADRHPLALIVELPPNDDSEVDT